MANDGAGSVRYPIVAMRRRDFVLLAAANVLAAACKGKPSAARCKHCGMRIDPSSAWRAEVVGEGGVPTSFDTPRCALTWWRKGRSEPGVLRFHEYYERKLRPGTELRFMIGGDVVGPMGPDLVPVDPSRVTKFIQDHGAEKALRLEEITLDVLSQ